MIECAKHPGSPVMAYGPPGADGFTTLRCRACLADEGRAEPLTDCPRHPGSSYYARCSVCLAEELAAEKAGPSPLKRYPIAPRGVFWSLQGEGHLRGFQMGFVRLAGCSVGCPTCDTDYSVAEKLTADELSIRCFQTFASSRDAWVWITGGEPTDHDLRPLLAILKQNGYSTAVATSGSRRLIPPVDWLSVSPHSLEPEKFQQRYGNEVKLVDGLNGLDLEAWADAWDRKPGAIDFMYRYVQPMSVRAWRHCDPGMIAGGLDCAKVSRRDCRCDPKGSHDHLVHVEDPASLARCLAFLKRHPTWALSRQDHHVWGVA